MSNSKDFGIASAGGAPKTKRATRKPPRPGVWDELVERAQKIPIPAPDSVNHPPHYQTAAGLEAIDVIQAFNLDFLRGNSVKYLLRAGKKGDALEDLRKARWYVDRAIAAHEAAAARHAGKMVFTDGIQTRRVQPPAPRRKRKAGAK